MLETNDFHSKMRAKMLGLYGPGIMCIYKHTAYVSTCAYLSTSVGLPSLSICEFIG